MAKEKEEGKGKENKKDCVCEVEAGVDRQDLNYLD